MAINAYRKHLDEGINKKGRKFSDDSVNNFKFFLEKIEEHFQDKDKNITLITTPECREFLHKYWAKSVSGTRKQRQNQLKIFFSFCIRHLKEKGSPIFDNPCDLLDTVEYHIESPEWIPIEVMREFLNSAKKEHHWLAFSIMATSGIRINDLMHLRKYDVEGRVLHLRSHGSYRPKSGRHEETAVIPEIVAQRLSQFVRDLKDMDNIMPVTGIAIYKAVNSHGKALGLKIGNHSLKKWCASYWERKGELGMVNFVLRHSPSKLRDRYIAPLTIEEVVVKQRILESELFITKDITLADPFIF